MSRESVDKPLPPDRGCWLPGCRCERCVEIERRESVGAISAVAAHVATDVLLERLRLVAVGARALALATTDPAAKVELERLAKLAEEGGR